MQFYFAKTDSLYKIFKALEKIPSHKQVEIFIDPEHSLFDNEWWWSQIKEIIDKNQIDAVFVAKNKKNRDFFTSVWLKVNYEKEKQWEKVLHMIWLFFFNIKKFHLHTYETKKYVFILIFIFEALLIFGILWFVISLIMPSATLTIWPSENSETVIYNVRYYPHNDQTASVENRYLYVPFYTWSLNYKYDLTISTANIKYISDPSYGQIKVYNTKDTSYELIKWTQFITSDWLIFRSTTDFILPEWTEKKPSETVITVKADEYDEYGNLIWVRWNILYDTQMRIKNLDESSKAKDIWAKTIENFVWWQTEASWSVTDKDIKLLEEKLINQVYDKKMSIVAENFATTGWLILPFETITTTKFNNIDINQMSWDSTPTIKWTAYVTYTYLYVLWDDLYQLFLTYVNERPTESNLLVTINPSSVQFLKDSNTTSSDEIRKNWKVYSISTQVSVTEVYDFEKDPKNIIPQIKDTIIWMDVSDARNYILTTFEEIGSIKISTPLWYDSIPVIKSRIKIWLNR